MTAAASFVSQLRNKAEVALGSPEARRDVFAIGPARFELGTPCSVVEDWLGRAFPLPAIPTAGGDAVHRLASWDSRDPASIPPERPWGPSDHEPLGIISSHSDERFRCAFDIHTSSLIACDLAEDAAYTWYPDIPGLPAWAKASPVRIALSWFLNTRRMQMVHGAAVSVGGRAALLAGAGGAGKSTTALASALAGLGYLGDDYCAVEPDTGHVHMVYRTAKVLPATLEMLPALGDWLVNREQIAEEKGVMFLSPREVDLVTSADLAMILLPRVSADGRAGLTPASRSDAVKAILPSTVGGLMGGGAFTPRAILALTHALPAYHLDLSVDLDAVVDVVATRLGDAA